MSGSGHALSSVPINAYSNVNAVNPVLIEESDTVCGRGVGVNGNGSDGECQNEDTNEDNEEEDGEDWEEDYEEDYVCKEREENCQQQQQQDYEYEVEYDQAPPTEKNENQESEYLYYNYEDDDEDYEDDEDDDEEQEEDELEDTNDHDHDHDRYLYRHGWNADQIEAMKALYERYRNSLAETYGRDWEDEYELAQDMETMYESYLEFQQQHA